MSDHTHTMPGPFGITLAQAQQQLLDSLPTAERTEQVALTDALDRVLASDIYSPFPVPAANNSAMDGFALRSDDVCPEHLGDTDTTKLQLWPVVGQSLAGHPFSGEVPVGACIRITTGGVLPDALNTVVMQEDVVRHHRAASELTGNEQAEQMYISLSRAPTPGQFVRLRGSELSTGQAVLKQGTVLGPLQLGLLATLGIAIVPVFAKIRVGVLSTGDELKQPGEALQPGDLYDSNRVVLRAVLTRLGATVTDFGWVADDPVAMRALFLQAASTVDVLVCSGGVSVGDADHTRAVLAELGSIGFWQVAMKPGKPFAFGKISDAAGQPCWFFGLPGNPVSAVVTCEQLLVPALQRLQGQTAQIPQLWPATAASRFKKKPGRLDLQRAKLQVSAEGVTVSAVGLDSSAMLTSMLEGDALVHLELPRGDVSCGESVWLQPKSPWWR
jgi:molybdopterin molybdotransferase